VFDAFTAAAAALFDVSLTAIATSFGADRHSPKSVLGGR
jgi:hypothetical protein